MLVLVWDEVTDKAVRNCFKKTGSSEIDDNDAVSDDPFTALKFSIIQLSILDKTFEDVTVEEVTSLYDILVSTQESLSNKDNLVNILAGDIDYQHESDKGDPQSEISEVLVKLNPSQIRETIDTLMNY